MADWTVPRLPELPSAHHFSSLIQPRNMPLVYEGCVKDWTACSRWRPDDGGLDYLKRIASDATVQAMVTTSGSDFYGDIRSHERVSISFGAFLDYASQSHLGQMEGNGLLDGEKKTIESFTYNPHSHLPLGSQLYLAQVPIYNKEQQELCPLKALMEDLSMPSFLDCSAVTNINLWMSASESKSSTHYDPFHNILCVVTGCKQVMLWPPSATPFLYPLPVYGEASNHSGVDFAKPDPLTHPLFERASNCCQTTVLHSGDALFIPEGWYHQVNSDSLTIAINIWWPSTIALAMDSHMDGYYFRRIVSSLLDREKEWIAEMATACETKKSEKDVEVSKQEHIRLFASNFSSKQITAESTAEKSKFIMHSSEFDKKAERISSLEGEELERQSAVESLAPLQKQSLQNLVVYVGDMMNAKEEQHIARKARYDCVQGDQLHGASGGVRAKDILAQVFSILEPLALKQVLLVMVNHFPRTLEALILHGLSPLAAELLTRKFDEMDKTISETEQAEFYKLFYSIFEDPQIAMSALLDGKEAFSALALDSVLERYLGSSFSRRSSTST